MKKQSSTIAKTRRQIAGEYGMHVNTLMRKLKKEGIKLPRGLVYPKEQELIYEALGCPTSPPLKLKII